MNIKRILCPIDFSDASTHAIDHAVAFANWCGARITALHVCRPPLLSDPGVEMSSHGQVVDDIDTENLRAQTAAFCKAATTAGINLEILIGHGEPTGRILEHATGLPADLIVIGTHGTSGFQHLLLGSVTEKVLRKASCAVLTVPPRAQATSRLPFQRLLCAVDFSDCSLTALQYAFSLAQESDAELTILHVVEWPWREPPAPSTSDLPPAQASALAEYRRVPVSKAPRRVSSRSCPRRFQRRANLQLESLTESHTSRRCALPPKTGLISSSSVCMAAIRSTCTCLDQRRIRSCGGRRVPC